MVDALLTAAIATLGVITWLNGRETARAMLLIRRQYELYELLNQAILRLQEHNRTSTVVPFPRPQDPAA